MKFSLEEIREEKQAEAAALEERKSLVSAVEKALADGRNPVIAEVKKMSPSKGRISDLGAAEAAKKMEEAGACAISVLTDRRFGGSLSDLAAVKKAVYIPVLRKDFVVDSSQLKQSRYMGADAVLLIVALLGEKTKEYVEEAHTLGLEALVEAHTEEELKIAVASGAKIIGVNNRDLSTLKVDLGVTEKLAGQVPTERILVSESGISSKEDILRLRKAGGRAFLVGSSIMESDDIYEKVRGLTR